jgi:hypothetical protein
MRGSAVDGLVAGSTPAPTATVKICSDEHVVGCLYRHVLLAPGTVAGLLDGDGSLALLPRGTGERRRYVPQVSYVVRDDDPTPMWVAISVAQLRGASVGQVRHLVAARDLGWWVGSVADVVAVTGFLTRAPLLSPRGWRQLSAVREAALVLADGRPYRSATEPLAPADIARLRELRATIPRADGSMTEPLPLPPVFAAVDDRYVGAYLAGLAAAEGCFELRSSGTHYYVPVFRLTQRVDNRALLEALCERIGIGRLAAVAVTKGAPAWQWVVDDRQGTGRLIEILREHPLPPGSPKARVFDAWTEAVAVRHYVRLGRARGSLRADPDLARLGRQIREIRRYRGPWACCGVARGGAAVPGAG